MVSILHRFLNKYPATHYYLACSAGIDSMVLLHLFHQLKVPFSVVHVNYHLRGKESKNDAQFVQAACTVLGVRCYLKSVHLKKHLEAQGGNLQQEARNIRYGYLESLLKQHPNSIGVTAHHADDQLETFWLHLIRGSGLSGLSGMVDASPTLLRPLLTTPRKKIESYAHNHGILWREDQSNSDTRYLRNFLRIEALPSLYQAFPQLKNEVNFLMRQFRKAHQSHQKQAEKIRKEWNAHGLIPLAHQGMDASVFIEALKRMEIEPRFYDRIQQLFTLANGKQLDVGTAGRLIKTKEGIRFMKAAPIDLRFHMETVQTLPQKFDAWTWFLNPEQIRFPLQASSFLPHEQLRPNGLQRAKSINALLKGARIPEHARKLWPVLRCGDVIVGIPGICIAHAFRANPKGSRFIKVTFEPW